MICRLARFDDEDGIIAVAGPIWKRMHADPWNEMQVRTVCRSLICSDHGTLFVLERDTTICGVFGIIAMDTLCGGVPVACEIAWFVADGAEGHGSKLLKAAEAWAARRGVKRIKVSAPTSRVAKALARRGYGPSETILERSF